MQQQRSSYFVTTQLIFYLNVWIGPNKVFSKPKCYFSVIPRKLLDGNWRTPGFFVSIATKQPRRSCPSCWSRRASNWTKWAPSASPKADHPGGRRTTAWRQLPQRAEVQPPLGTSQDSAKTHLRQTAPRNQDPQAEAEWADSRERKLDESGSSKLTRMLVAWPKITINSIELLRLLPMLLCWIS